MEYQNYLKSVFTIWEQVLTISSPVFVKSIQMHIEYKDVLKCDDENILMGTVSFVVNTEDKCFSVEWGGVVEPYTDSESKKKAERTIAHTLGDLLKEEYEDGKYEKFWDDIDFNKEDWKKGGE